jgi:NADH-quinone oxidoreductase subunit H
VIDSLTQFLNEHWDVIISLVKIMLLVFIVLTVNAYLTWFERKVVAHMQSRWGPHRVGPHGLLQPAADGLKFLLKEDPTPNGVDKFTYYLAPLMALALALTSIAIIPFGPDPIVIFGHKVYLGIVDLNIGLLALFAITALSVYGVALAGWSSNSKYSMLGGLRASAQMVSYELALGLSLIGVLIFAGSFSLSDIVNSQMGTWFGFIPKWNIFKGQFVAFFIYIMAAYAETNRIPFDLPEAETELVAGYHTEYSSMKFAMFFMAEYANMVTVACLASVLFLGGWTGPTFGPPILQSLLPVFWFALRVFVFMFIYIWVRGTLPRFRYDQLMAFGWKFLLPLAIANIVVTALVVALK